MAWLPTVVSATAAVLLCGSTPSPGPPLAPGPRPNVVAHRGARTERPECTLAAIQRAIELRADVVELDVRMSKDGVPFLLHDVTLDRTTNGRGQASARTIRELKQLDAGSWFGTEWRGERIPTLAEALELCRDRIAVLLDLKESGDRFARAVASVVRKHGDPNQVILGVRSPEQARRFRTLLPQIRQLGFVPSPQLLPAFADAGIQIVRLWQDWLHQPDGRAAVEMVRRYRLQLMINARGSRLQDLLPLLRWRPDFVLVDDVAAANRSLDAIDRARARLQRLDELIQDVSSVTVVPWIAQADAPTFLNRNYRMLELPDELDGLPRIMFAGGEGAAVKLRFLQPAIVFAVFEYNDTGAWSFPEGLGPADFRWRPFRQRAYRGTSNGTLGGKPHYATIWYRRFEQGEHLEQLPPWWLCLAIVPADHGSRIIGEQRLSARERVRPLPFLYEQWAERAAALRIPNLRTQADWRRWRREMRARFVRRFVFPHQGDIRFWQPPGDPRRVGSVVIHEIWAVDGDRRLFRFFKLVSGTGTGPRPTIVCFMGHGKVRQVLEDRDSYQQACALRFAERGYVTFAMENVGMEPGRDRHLELDRILRPFGYGWYSLLFAHQRIVLEYVFADPTVDRTRVGVAGVSTGGLLALSAAAMDPRVRAASVHGIFGSIQVSFIRDRRRHCSCGAIPGLLPEFDLPILALMVAPRALHISNGLRDGFSPHEARRCLRLLQPVYRKMRWPVPEFTTPSIGHAFAFDESAAFFERVLGGPNGRTEPERSSAGNAANNSK